MFKHMLIVALLIFVGCGTDTDIDLAKTSPEIGSVEVCTLDGRVFVDLLVLEPSKQPTSIALKVESTGDELIATDGTMGLIAPGPSGEGLSGLTTHPDGRWHRIEWNLCEESSKCSLPSDIAELGGSTSCICVEQFRDVSRFTIGGDRRSESVGSTYTETITDIEVAPSCPSR